MDRVLVLVRHGQSEWNLKNLFTGWRDVGLTEQGTKEAKSAGRKLAERGFKFDIAFTSALSRAQVTCQHILDAVGHLRVRNQATAIARECVGFVACQCEEPNCFGNGAVCETSFTEYRVVGGGSER